MQNPYQPEPIDTEDVALSGELLDLLELLAENTHAVWAAGRLLEGWRYGPARDDEQKVTPCLVPYAALPEAEKEFDRSTARQVLKTILRLGYRILPPAP